MHNVRLAPAQDVDGYFGNEAYPSLFHASLTPASLDAAARRAGLRRPATRRRFRMLDIGCGDGYGLALIAAAHPEGEFVGIDGLPSHIDKGCEFAKQLGVLNLQLRCQTFEQALQGEAEPFDYIVCHGVISWVNATNRERAIGLGARHLADDGVFYLGYNAMPGLAPMLTFQRLVHRVAATLDGPAVERFHRAVDVIDGWRVAPIHSLSEWSIDRLRARFDHVPDNYLTHEYLQDCWQPQWSEDVHSALVQHGLRFLASSRILHHRPDLRLRKAQREALDGVDNPVLRETLIDSFVDESFRQDLFVHQSVSLEAPADTVMDTWLGASTSVAEADLQSQTPAGKIRFDNPSVRAVLEALADKPRPIADLVACLPFNRADVLNAIDCLLVEPHVVPLAGAGDAESIMRANQRLLQRVAQGEVINGLIGIHGPIMRSTVDVLLTSIDPQSLVARARADSKLCKLLFSNPENVNDSQVVELVESQRARVNTHNQRLGVQV